MATTSTVSPSSLNPTPQAPPNPYYTIRAIPSKGYGCIATAPIKRGTRILADTPLLIVPIASYLASNITAEFEKLSPSDQAKYFTLHSGHGQDPKNWPSRIHESVDEHERKRIQEQHNARIGKEASLISIFQVNCMEVGRGAGVFPHAARFNHHCNPNACFTYNSSIERETIHAMRDIKEGEEITISYCDTIHDTPLRTWELKHYGFTCSCPACSGDVNDENSFAYKSAERRFRLGELERETRFLRGSRLDEGAKQEGFVKKLLEMAALHLEEGDWTARLANVFLDIALVCEYNNDLRMAAVTAGKAVEIKKDCQGEDFPEYTKYVAVLERIETKLGL